MRTDDSSFKGQVCLNHANCVTPDGTGRTGRGSLARRISNLSHPHFAVTSLQHDKERKEIEMSQIHVVAAGNSGVTEWTDI